MVTNSKILVAGGTGFIGSNLISELVSNGNEIISISKKSQETRNQNKNINFVFHDLTKPIDKNLKRQISNVDYVVNCSGYIDHRDFKYGGKDVYSNHFESLYRLSNIAIEVGVKAFIHLGSSDEYGKNKSPLKECIRESPLSPYALGKLSATHYLQQCFRKGLLNTVVIRPFLVFGEKQNKDRFLPFLIDNCLKDKEFKVSKGEQIRDYLYIKDFNDALIKSINNNKAYGEVINIASGVPISIKEVIENVQKIVGKGKPIIGGLDYREGESMELYADINKARKILNWEPKYKLYTSLQQVIRWYLNNE